ncbi:hypothetical protein SAMN04487975_105139 [Planococcus glaciei]|nr:hypothetical protein SAMN04487975_105139 [Planococcus glaciei]
MTGVKRLKFLVLGDKTKLEIEVLQRNYPNSRDYWDANWIASRIHLEIPGYTAHFEADLRTNELKEFADELRDMNEALKGTATLKNLDDYIHLTGTMNSLGKIIWNLETRFPAGDSAKLSCTFTSDQSYLRILIDEVDTVLEAYPVVGKVR